MDLKKKFETRQYRAFVQLGAAVALPGQKRLESDFYVDGFATTFQPYEFFETEEGMVYESFSREAFNGTDMSDVIMQLNHEGRVFARQSNGTLLIEPIEYGLFFAADLSKTAPAKQIYEEIKTGMLTKMSWGFLPGEYYYDRENRTIVHTKVKKIFDVSVVSIPANNQTEIHARAFADGLIEQAKQELLKRDRQKKRLLMQMALSGTNQ